MTKILRTPVGVWIARCFVFLLFASAPALSHAGESWDAVFIRGVKVGYQHLYVTPVKYKDQDYLRIRFDLVMILKRDHDEVIIKLRYGTIETLEGEVVRLETQQDLGEDVSKIKGEVEGDKMRLSIEIAGKKQEQLVDWSPDTFGPYALEMSLARKPIKPGEKRSLKSFIPILNKVVTLEVSAIGNEDVELGDGKPRNLMRVEQKGFLDGQPFGELDGVFWSDTSGQIMKGKTEGDGGMTIFRTTEAAAKTMPPAASRLNILALSIIKVSSFPNADKSSDVVYRVVVNGNNAAKIFPNDRRQTVKPTADGKGATVHVRTMDPSKGDPGPETVAEEFTEPNPLIDSADPTILRYAQEAVGTRTDPWQKAVAVEEWVAKNLKNKNFQTSFASATEVAQSLAGDCTEHAVLAAAMSKAVGLPSRVATGIVYAPIRKGLASTCGTKSMSIEDGSCSTLPITKPTSTPPTSSSRILRWPALPHSKPSSPSRRYSARRASGSLKFADKCMFTARGFEASSPSPALQSSPCRRPLESQKCGGSACKAFDKEACGE